MKTLVIGLVLAFTAGIASAQGYYGSQQDYQQTQQTQQTQTQHINPYLNPVDPRDFSKGGAFEIKDLPQVAPLNPRSSGVILGPNGEAYYWYGN